jgi:hypothetical protein
MITILDLFGSSGGVGRCTKEMLRQFGTEGLSTTLCGQSHVIDSFKIDRQETPNLQLVNLERPRFSLKSIKLKLAGRSRYHSSRLADILLQETIGATSARNGSLQLPVLVNYPQVIMPPSSPNSFCLFLHDLNWRLYPGNFSTPDLTDRNCRGWVERASKVITNSECTRDEVMEYYQCAPEKVVAAPLAQFDGKIPDGHDAWQYLARLGLTTGGFYLFPGVWGLHKGHDILTEAIEESLEGSDPVVVTCGLPSDGIAGNTAAVAALRKSLATRWDRLIARKQLVVVGGVSEFEMQALRVGCRAYVLPSLYEGFGFPLVEAIYHHRPAIASEIKAHREILNRYPQYKLARLFPAGSSKALAIELNRSVQEPMPMPMPKGWQKSIETSWSWKNTIQRIVSGLTAAADLKQ